MQKIKILLLKIQTYYKMIDNFLNQHWLLIFLTVSTLFFLKLGSGIFSYIETEEYMNIHNQIFVMSLFCFISIYFVRPSVLWFLIPFLIVRLIDFHEFFTVFQNYFFNKSIFAHLFENLASKDINVIIISFFVVYMIFVLIILVVYKIIKKKWHLKSSFLFMTLFVYLLTTLLFHYFLIEKNYRHIINNELIHMTKVSNAKEKDFKIICINQEYICANSKEEIKEKVNNQDFNIYIDKIPEHYNIRGNFSFGDIENIYLVIKNENQWVINKDLAKQSFHDSGNYLMICLDIAHTFWLLFFIWLNVFHFRKQFKRS